MSQLTERRKHLGHRLLPILAIGGLVLCFTALSRLMGQLALALLLTALALPLEKQFEKRCSRPWAAGGAVGVLLLGIVGFLVLLVPSLIAQLSLVIGEVPKLAALIRSGIGTLTKNEWFRRIGASLLQPGGALEKLGTWAAESLPRLLSSVAAGVNTVSRAFLAPILSYYFLRDREVFCYRLSLWIPSRHRKQVLIALKEMRLEVGGYVRGQLLVAAAVAVLTALGLLAVGVPAWLVLGLLMGACELIPYVGPLIGGIPIALFSLPGGLSKLLWALGVAIAVQQIEGYFLSPKLMAGATGLHPVYVLLLLSAGGLLFGLIGMVLALPVFVCVRGAARVLCEKPPKPTV